MLEQKIGQIDDYVAASSSREMSTIATGTRKVQGVQEWFNIGKKIEVPSNAIEAVIINLDDVWKQFGGMLEQFERFRGTIEFDLEVISSPFDFGSFYFGWEPSEITVTQLINTSIFRASYPEGILVDLREHNHVRLEVPWTASTKYVSSNVVNQFGSLYIKPINQIQSTVVGSQVDYVLYARIKDIDMSIPYAQSGGEGMNRVNYGFKTDTAIENFSPDTIGPKALIARPTIAFVETFSSNFGTVDFRPGIGNSRLEQIAGELIDHNLTVRVHLNMVKTPLHAGVIVITRTRMAFSGPNFGSEKIIWNLKEKSSIVFDVAFPADAPVAGGFIQLFNWQLQGLRAPETVKLEPRMIISFSSTDLSSSGFAQCWNWKEEPAEVMKLGQSYRPKTKLPSFEELMDGKFQLYSLGTNGTTASLRLRNTLTGIDASQARILSLFYCHSSKFDFKMIPQAGIMSAATSGFSANLPARFDQLTEVNFDNEDENDSANPFTVEGVGLVSGAARPMHLSQAHVSSVCFYANPEVYRPRVLASSRQAAVTINAAMRPSFVSVSLEVEPKTFFALTLA